MLGALFTLFFLAIALPGQARAGVTCATNLLNLWTPIHVKAASSTNDPGCWAPGSIGAGQTVIKLSRVPIGPDSTTPGVIEYYSPDFNATYTPDANNYPAGICRSQSPNPRTGLPSCKPDDTCRWGLGYSCNYEVPFADGTVLRYTLRGGIASAVSVSGGAFDPPAPVPVIMSMGHESSPIAPNEGARLQYYLTNPNTNHFNRADSVEFDHDVAAFAPNLVSVTGLPADGFCGPGSQARTGNGNYITFRNLQIPVGGTCSFDVAYRIGDVPLGPLRQTTSSLKAYFNGVLQETPAVTDYVTVVDDPDTLPPEVSASDQTFYATNGTSASGPLTAQAYDARGLRPPLRYFLDGTEIAANHTFPVGDYTVEVVATDHAGNQSSATFAVHVIPVLRPTVTGSMYPGPGHVGETTSILYEISLPAGAAPVEGIAFSHGINHYLNQIDAVPHLAFVPGRLVDPCGSGSEFVSNESFGYLNWGNLQPGQTCRFLAPVSILPTSPLTFATSIIGNWGASQPESGTSFSGNNVPVAVGVVAAVVPEAPELTLPNDIAAVSDPGGAGAVVDFAVTASDQTDGDLTGAVVLSHVSGSRFPLGETVVTAEVTDSDLNTTTGSFRIMVAETPFPTIALSADKTSLAQDETARIQFQLSAPATDFTSEDVSVLGGTLADFTGTGQTYTATFTPNADSALTGAVWVANEAFTNAEGTPNWDGTDADNRLEFTIDTVGPSAQIAELTGPENGVFTALITLGEASTDFTVDDLDLVNATATFGGYGQDYTVQLTPLAQGPFSVTVRAGSFSDEFGNSNPAASNTVSGEYDSVAPSVEITGAPDSFTGQSPITLTIRFSEPVTGFDLSDINLANAETVLFFGIDAEYIVQIQPTGHGDVQMQILANVAQDAGGNGNLASELIEIGNHTVSQTQAQIAQFIASRANQLLAHQPDLTCHLQGTCGGGSAMVEINGGTTQFALSSRPDQPIWFLIAGSRSDDIGGRSDYLFGAIGSHWKFSPNALAGVLLEIDHMSNSDSPSRIKGTGWMLGPYFVAKLPEQPLFFEGRLLGGTTRNRISPFGSYSDRFTTRRLLAQLKVSGQLEYGQTTLIPSLSGSYTTDRQQAYTDSLGNLIPKQGVALGQLAVGLDFRTPVLLFDHPWMIGGGASGIYTKSSTSGFVPDADSGFEGGRGRVTFSASTTMRNGGQVNLSAHYDGLGASDYEAYGIELGLNWAF